ncbi:hypothetical protein BaRGS_00008713 [Batillaria attramentaria]|uniref:Uncharacterized protein n=1 Tax=Batillaria attramentaria TaxID=370345 RepID=A0ABD0LLP2_9CAEN
MGDCPKQQNPKRRKTRSKDTHEREPWIQITTPTDKEKTVEGQVCDLSRKEGGREDSGNGGGVMQVGVLRKMNGLTACHGVTRAGGHGLLTA